MGDGPSDSRDNLSRDNLDGNLSKDNLSREIGRSADTPTYSHTATRIQDVVRPGALTHMLRPP